MNYQNPHPPPLLLLSPLLIPSLPHLRTPTRHPSWHHVVNYSTLTNPQHFISIKQHWEDVQLLPKQNITLSRVSRGDSFLLYYEINCLKEVLKQYMDNFSTSLKRSADLKRYVFKHMMIHLDSKSCQNTTIHLINCGDTNNRRNWT